MLAPGFDVDPDALGGVAAAVRGAVTGSDADGLLGAAGGAADFGHDGLHAALTGLTALVGSSVAALRRNASGLAQGVAAAAAAYTEADAAGRQLLTAGLAGGR